MGFGTYLLKRIAFAVFTIWVVITLNFIIFGLLPGDPTKYMLDPSMTEQQKELIRQQYGLYDPWPIKYLKYIRNLLSFGLLPP